mmetsp:Transcript_56188/g.121041  ORF Transcript_56188/g.121041 Transcript_56188/m.121041 type:complete len:263 (-) Transcript_56188:656-1444(-)
MAHLVVHKLEDLVAVLLGFLAVFAHGCHSCQTYGVRRVFEGLHKAGKSVGVPDDSESVACHRPDREGIILQQGANGAHFALRRLAKHAQGLGSAEAHLPDLVVERFRDLGNVVRVAHPSQCGDRCALRPPHLRDGPLGSIADLQGQARQILLAVGQERQHFLSEVCRRLADRRQCLSRSRPHAARRVLEAGLDVGEGFLGGHDCLGHGAYGRHCRQADSDVLVAQARGHNAGTTLRNLSTHAVDCEQRRLLRPAVRAHGGHQ